VAFVPRAAWKRREDLPKHDGLEGAVILGPKKRPRGCGDIFDAFSVGKEAVVTVINVVLVNKTREKLDVGIPWSVKCHVEVRKTSWMKTAVVCETATTYLDEYYFDLGLRNKWCFRRPGRRAREQELKVR
jgi:hypothetical protein